MRAWLTLTFLAACGPIYGNQQPQQQAAQQPQYQAGPPGGGADPWSGSTGDGASTDPDGWGPSGDPDGSGSSGDATGGGTSGGGGTGGSTSGAGGVATRGGSTSGATGGSTGGASGGGTDRTGAAGGAPPAMRAIVEAHNAHRAKHCAAPLAWSPRLAQAAQAWADSLVAQGCKFGHKPRNPYGENLAAGTSGTLDGQAVAEMWYEEVKLYRFPDGGFSMQTGHFTQVVWRGTSQIGCGVATCNGMDIWVCEYDPPGNVETRYRQNVLPAGC